MNALPSRHRITAPIVGGANSLGAGYEGIHLGDHP
jgi:hypothetical protein